MTTEEGEYLHIELTGGEVSDFRTLLLDVIKATKLPGVSRLILSPDADRILTTLISHLTQ